MASKAYSVFKSLFFLVIKVIHTYGRILGNSEEYNKNILPPRQLLIIFWHKFILGFSVVFRMSIENMFANLVGKKVILICISLLVHVAE